MKKIILLSIIALAITGCSEYSSQTTRDAEAVESQQSQVSKSQPVPKYDWSLERHLLIQIYNIRNIKAVTHSVWRSDRGIIEGDCPSMGFGIPYDSSLTNPLTNKLFSKKKISSLGDYFRSWGVVEQPEPNSIFASKNTAATWVLCIGETGNIEPHYIETKVSGYPYPVTVNYETNRVIRAGKATVNIKLK